ncbi:MAG: maltokinase N-terminal cap-like domain-containing protein [Solirubrobacteraceae bacterium]
MTGPVQSPAQALTRSLDLEALGAWIEGQRWYASKSRHVSAIEIEECALLVERPPLLLALVAARFATGSHELYQLPLTLLAPSQSNGRAEIVTNGEWVAVDSVADPERARDLLRRIDDGGELEAEEGAFHFHRVEGSGALSRDASARPVGVEQSNSSIVFGEQTVLKVFRKLEPGINPELELLQFLTRHGFANIAPLLGWYDYEGRSFSATLGVAQRFFPDAIGGWELALDQIGSDFEGLEAELGALGTVTAELHNVLGSDSSDPAFSSEEPSAESLALLTATIDEDIERIFIRLPDDERVASIAGRGQDVRERIAMRSQVGGGGRAIRTHGDFHLGQTLHTPRGWVIIDFEGEPARPLFERRQKRSPLRDVASMLRSFAYATSAMEIIRARPAPPDFEDRARRTFLEHYFSTIDPALLPAGEAAVINLLTIFELEKAIYELNYELDNRPDWLPIPVAGIARLLESE